MHTDYMISFNCAVNSGLHYSGIIPDVVQSTIPWSDIPTNHIIYDGRNVFRHIFNASVTLGVIFGAQYSYL